MPNSPVTCANCEIEMDCIHTGAFVEEFASFGSYKLWQADVFACRICRARVIRGFGREPIAEHYQPNYAEQLKKYVPTYKIKSSWNK